MKWKSTTIIAGKVRRGGGQSEARRGDMRVALHCALRMRCESMFGGHGWCSLEVIQDGREAQGRKRACVYVYVCARIDRPFVVIARTAARSRARNACPPRPAGRLSPSV